MPTSHEELAHVIRSPSFQEAPPDVQLETLHRTLSETAADQGYTELSPEQQYNAIRLLVERHNPSGLETFVRGLPVIGPPLRAAEHAEALRPGTRAAMQLFGADIESPVARATAEALREVGEFAGFTLLGNVAGAGVKGLLAARATVPSLTTAEAMSQVARSAAFRRLVGHAVEGATDLGLYQVASAAEHAVLTDRPVNVLRDFVVNPALMGTVGALLGVGGSALVRQLGPRDIAAGRQLLKAVPEAEGVVQDLGRLVRAMERTGMSRDAAFDAIYQGLRGVPAADDVVRFREMVKADPELLRVPALQALLSNSRDMLEPRVLAGRSETFRVVFETHTGQTSAIESPTKKQLDEMITQMHQGQGFIRGAQGPGAEDFIERVKAGLREAAQPPPPPARVRAIVNGEVRVIAGDDLAGLQALDADIRAGKSVRIVDVEGADAEDLQALVAQMQAARGPFAAPAPTGPVGPVSRAPQHALAPQFRSPPPEPPRPPEPPEPPAPIPGPFRPPGPPGAGSPAAGWTRRFTVESPNDVAELALREQIMGGMSPDIQARYENLETPAEAIDAFYGPPGAPPGDALRAAEKLDNIRGPKPSRPPFVEPPSRPTPSKQQGRTETGERPTPGPSTTPTEIPRTRTAAPLTEVPPGTSVVLDTGEKGVVTESNRLMREVVTESGERVRAVRMSDGTIAPEKRVREEIALPAGSRGRPDKKIRDLTDEELNDYGAYLETRAMVPLHEHMSRDAVDQWTRDMTTLGAVRAEIERRYPGLKATRPSGEGTLGPQIKEGCK